MTGVSLSRGRSKRAVHAVVAFDGPSAAQAALVAPEEHSIAGQVCLVKLDDGGRKPRHHVVGLPDAAEDRPEGMPPWAQVRRDLLAVRFLEERVDHACV